MPKKRKKKRPRPTRPLAPAKFAVCGQVRVKPGTTVPGFEDIPLGGWSGTIREIEQDAHWTNYLIAWDQRTLAGMHPIFGLVQIKVTKWGR